MKCPLNQWPHPLFTSYHYCWHLHAQDPKLRNKTELRKPPWSATASEKSCVTLLQSSILKAHWVYRDNVNCLLEQVSSPSTLTFLKSSSCPALLFKVGHFPAMWLWANDLTALNLNVLLWTTWASLLQRRQKSGGFFAHPAGGHMCWWQELLGSKGKCSWAAWVVRSNSAAQL
jgi:hypothetical protein